MSNYISIQIFKKLWSSVSLVCYCSRHPKPLLGRNAPFSPCISQELQWLQPLFYQNKKCIKTNFFPEPALLELVSQREYIIDAFRLRFCLTMWCVFMALKSWPLRPQVVGAPSSSFFFLSCPSRWREGLIWHLFSNWIKVILQLSSKNSIVINFKLTIYLCKIS